VNRFVLPLAGFAILVVMFGISLKRAPEKQFVQSALIGKQAPTFTLQNLDAAGGTIQSTQFKGRWTLLNVWGTWCAECRAEHATLLDIKREGKVQLVGLNYRDDDTAARQWLVQLGNPYDVTVVDHEGRAAIDWGVYGAPETFLINPASVIVYKHLSQITPEVWRTKFLPMIEGAKP
jgi:cytochrome c biogenesis protein CcmG, thiol:disulfide interchange protein DsbE